jgi:hypothetical protein
MNLLTRLLVLVRFWPGSVDQAVKILMRRISSQDKKYIKSLAYDRLITLYHTLGAYIRSAFGLWHNNEALLESCREINPNAIHPDDASMVIIKAFWSKLQNS